MNRPQLAAGLFAIAATAQLAIPASQVWRYEHTLREGKVFKFRSAPVDPYDAFRGRYVALGFEDVHAKWSDPTMAESGDRIYATIEVGSDGFATLGTAARQVPANGDYLIVEARYPSLDSVMVRYPFDHFYMREDLAPKAEDTYREHASRTKRDAYTVVRVLNGTGVIEQVFIGNQTLAEAAKGTLVE